MLIHAIVTITLPVSLAEPLLNDQYITMCRFNWRQHPLPVPLTKYRLLHVNTQLDYAAKSCSLKRLRNETSASSSGDTAWDDASSPGVRTGPDAMG